MRDARQIDGLVKEIVTASSLTELGIVLAGISCTLGFDYFCIARYSRSTSRNLQLTNYPASWLTELEIDDFPAADPIAAACERSALAFCWSDIPRVIKLTDRHRTILLRLREVGLGDGITVPVHLPGEAVGSTSFAMAAGGAVNRAVLPAAQCVGCFAFEAARQLVRPADCNSPDAELRKVPRLSSRQLDCITLAAQGKSDVDAGQLLGISNQTVHQHIETAKRRYGVATRMQLIILALFNNQLEFRDVLGY
jgi:LuxR family quorum-sensing system transcriptional regulator CciR